MSHNNNDRIHSCSENLLIHFTGRKTKHIEHTSETVCADLPAKADLPTRADIPVENRFRDIQHLALIETHYADLNLMHEFRQVQQTNQGID